MPVSVVVKLNKPRRGTFKPNYGAMREIEKAVESSPQLRKEIARTFQVANRRMQNIENAGLISPAVVAANKGDINRFTKFSMKGSWESLKEEYARAISFLSDETSTASGARQYKKALQSMLNLNNEPELFEQVYSNMANNINSIVANEQANFTYQSIMDVIKNETQNAARSIESRVAEYEREIQRNIRKSAESFFKNLAEGNVLM